MTIIPFQTKKKVAFADGYINWVILRAVDDMGLTQITIMGSDYNRCLKDMNQAILELEHHGNHC